jgi:hypothetical protein
MVMLEYVSVAVKLLASVTVTVNDAVPAAVGVPEITPLELRVNPAGSVPELTLKIYGVVPPVALIVWL